MNFQLHSKNTRFMRQSLRVPLDLDAFGGLTTVEQMDAKLQATTERINRKENTLMSNKSSSSMGSQSEFLNIYALMISQVNLPKTPGLQQFCQYFGIPIKELESIKCIEEREDFVIECMGKCVKEQVQNFMMKSELKEHEQRVEEWTDFQKIKMQNLNIFQWLDINSKYLNLRKKLQYALIDTLTDDQNQKTISDYYKKLPHKLQSRSPSISTGLSRHRIASIQDPIILAPKLQVNQVAMNNVTWNRTLECQYQEKAKRGSALGLYPILQKALLDNVGQSLWSQQREALLVKFTDGGLLTVDEMKFIANTSPLLNSCADKEFIQRTIAYLDQKIIDEIEFRIAESILSTFQLMKGQLRLERQHWLQNNNHQAHKDLKDQSMKLMKKIETQINTKKLEKIKRKMTTIFREVQRKNEVEIQKAFERESYMRQQAGRNKFVYQFKEKLMALVRAGKSKKKVQASEEFLRRNLTSRARLLFKVNGEMQNTDQIKRLFHPTSKLLMSENQVKSANCKLQEHQFKLNIRSISASKQQFSQYLSGGPIRDRPYATSRLNDNKQHTDDDKPYLQKWITPEIEVAAINKIKASFRAYLQRKKYVQVIELQEQQPQQPIVVDESKFKRERVMQIKSVFVQSITKSNTIMVSDKAQQRAQKQLKQFHQQRIRAEMKLKTRKLFQAVHKKNLAIAIASGFAFSKEDCDYPDEKGRTPFSYAAEYGDENMCNYFHQLHGNLDIPDKQGNTPMHYAFQGNNSAVVIRMIHQGGNLNAINNNGLTPLAFGNGSLLQKLNLMDLVATSIQKPTFNNNSSINRRYPSAAEKMECAEFINSKRSISRF